MHNAGFAFLSEVTYKWKHFNILSNSFAFPICVLTNTRIINQLIKLQTSAEKK